MNELKWIKLSIEMFSNYKIRQLRRLPDGNNIVLIWVALLTLAGRCNAGGMIFLTENIPYTTKMLADELEFEENTVKLAIEALESFGMISTEGFLSIVGWEEHQNEEALSAIRERNRIAKQKYREKQKQKQLEAGVGFLDKANDASSKSNAVQEKGNTLDMSQDMSQDMSKDRTLDMSKDNGKDNSRTPSYILDSRDDSLLNSQESIEKEIGVQGEEEKQTVPEKPKKATKKEQPLGVFEEFAGDDADLLDALNEYEKMRNGKRKPMTDRAKTLLVNKLREKYPPHQWAAIVDQSTLNGWDSVYPLKEDESWGGRNNRGRQEEGNVFFQNAREMAVNEYVGN